jgi:hypothetical protein
VDTTIKTSTNLDKEDLAVKALHSRTVQRTKLTEQLTSLFAEASVGGSGEVNLEELATFFDTEHNTKGLVELTGLTKYNAINTWESMETDGSADMEDYIDGLVLSSHQSEERIMLRVEAELHTILRAEKLILEELGVLRGVEDAKPVESSNGSERRATSKLKDLLHARDKKQSDSSKGWQCEKTGGLPQLFTEVLDLRTQISGLHDALANVRQDIKSSMPFASAQVPTITAEIKKVMQMAFPEAKYEDLRRDVQQLREEIICAAGAEKITELGQQDLKREIMQLRDEVIHAPGSVKVSELVNQVADELSVGLASVEVQITALQSDIASFVKPTDVARRGVDGKSQRSEDAVDKEHLAVVESEVTALRAEIGSFVQSLRTDSTASLDSAKCDTWSLVGGGDSRNASRLADRAAGARLPDTRVTATRHDPFATVPAKLPSQDARGASSLSKAPSQQSLGTKCTSTTEERDK